MTALPQRRPHTEDNVHFAALGCDLKLEDIYEKVAFPELEPAPPR